ncbi:MULTISPECIES: hypothetical protein [Fictibacillus]|uniref:hypothetical protein n=1 Tax=Fictibacillus TaxID=1329200 RepID=UPI0010293894|nr:MULTISPECIES: hypothetical protein [Fictibacillus]RZT24048.1 hypothetical protein EV282_3149 [Fictibacillus sp. BK138]
MSNNQKETEDQIRAQNMHQTCQHHMFYHVIVKTNDGQQTEGIITDLDKKNVYMLVPQDMMPADEQESPQSGPGQGTGQQAAGPQQTMQQQGTQQQNQRQWYGRPRYRRFYRQIFPLATLAALSLYPYYPPYPYPPYPYPYYPYPYSYPYPYY